MLTTNIFIKGYNNHVRYYLLTNYYYSTLHYYQVYASAINSYFNYYCGLHSLYISLH